jgi:hypothetical protein
VTELYEASPVKERHRRTNAELNSIDAAIVAAVEVDHPISLRGVFYRVVSAGAIEKTEVAYNVIGRQLLKLRRAGDVPYNHITDGTRELTEWRTWHSLEGALANTAATYRRALWDDQDSTVIMLTEKDAITGVIRPVLAQWDVPMGVLRGYASESFCWQVAQYVIAAPGDVHIYQLGDHDPSGLGAWDDFQAKVRRMVTEETDYDDYGWLRCQRLAVTPGQIRQWGLPTRPTKKSPHSKKWTGGESVEVDAIRPAVLRQLVRDAIEQHIDQEALRITREAERSEREILLRIGQQYQDGDS